MLRSCEVIASSTAQQVILSVDRQTCWLLPYDCMSRALDFARGTMRNVTFAATQTSCTWDREANVATAERLVRHAAGQGAQIILLQELFETPYFCQDQKQEFFGLA